MFIKIFSILAIYLISGELNANTPGIQLNLGDIENPDNFVPALKILSILTILSVAPAILLMTTSFSRILIILSFVRQAVGTTSMPPNQVLVGLALFLTMYTMAPIWEHVEKKALNPYMEKKISQKEALENAIHPLKLFMLQENRKEDLLLFYNIAKETIPDQKEQISLTSLMPAFMISELKTAFQIGFMVYIPFLIVDMVVSSILMAMGMVMLPPTVVSLPFKLILFVLVDGWALIVSSIVKSFQLGIQ